MKTTLKLATYIVALALLAGTVAADWDEGGPHKMHYPQLPNPNGWDVDVMHYTLADDWMCTESGPVNSIHFWVSWFADMVGEIDVVFLSIHDDDRTGPWSKPGTLLWAMEVVPGQFVWRYYGEGVQGWIEPGDPPMFEVSNHFSYFQINVTNFGVDAFIQEQGKIYWLDVRIMVQDPSNTWVGWKSSMEHFEDDAVYWDEMRQDWFPLEDPLTQETLDLSFVICPVPEPAAALFALALFAVGSRQRR